MPPKKGKKKEKKKGAAGKDDPAKEEKDPRDNQYELDLHEQLVFNHLVPTKKCFFFFILFFFIVFYKNSFKIGKIDERKR